MSDLAARMYPEQAQPDTAAASKPDNSGASLEQRMYPPTPERDPMLPRNRETTTADRLYASTRFENMAGIEGLAKTAGHDPRTVQENLASAFNELDLSPLAAKEVIAVIREVAGNPPTAETVKKWQDETNSSLRRVIGSDFDAATQKAAQFLHQRAPEFAKAVEAAGLMNHPKFLKLMIEARRSAAGKRA